MRSDRIAVGLGLQSQAAERALDKEVLVAALLDQVWSAWTTREGIVSFFAPDAKVEPRVGGAFQIYIDPGAEPGMKGADEKMRQDKIMKRNHSHLC